MIKEMQPWLDFFLKPYLDNVLYIYLNPKLLNGNVAFVQQMEKLFCVYFQRFNLGAQLYYKVMESMLKSVSL